MEKEKPVLDITATNTFLYNSSDMFSIMTAADRAEKNSKATVTLGGKVGYVPYTNFGSYIMNEIGGTISGDMQVAASCDSVELERNPGYIQIKANKKTYVAKVDTSTIGIDVTATPYKSTFKPIATRYELSNDDVESLKNTFGSLCKEVVYRVSGFGSNTPTFGYMNPTLLCDLAGVSLLRSGAAVSKYKNIKIFKLNNGIGLKLGNDYLVSITEANPMYTNNEKVFIKQQDPDTSRVYYEPVKVKISKGFNPNLKQFAYDIVMDNGNQIYDVPESELAIVESTTTQEQQANNNDVLLNHF